MNKIFIKSAVKAIMLLCCCFMQGCGSLRTTPAENAPKYAYYETDSYKALIMLEVGTPYERHDGHICNISLKDGILQSKEIILPPSIVYNGISYSITKICSWEEYFIEPKRSHTSEPLELAVERIVLPNTIEDINYKGFERFKNLKMINTPESLDTKSIFISNLNFNKECSSAYKDNIVKQWKSRENGASLSAFNNYSFNNYKWGKKVGSEVGFDEESWGIERVSTGFEEPSNTNIADVTNDKHSSNVGLNDNKIEAAPAFHSDVNTNIPTASRTNENTFAVIISNENYRRESKVEYALSDGETFKKYCLKTLGIPQSNVHHVNDATLNDIRAEIRWIEKVAGAYNGEAKFIFYYAGHGIPDERTRSAYLLPIDGFCGDVATGYKISELYARLSKCPSEYTLVLLDACFSGAERSGKMLASSRGIALKPKKDIPSGNLIVFSAAGGDETAFPYKEQQHGMFTYFLLKKLQESNGEVTFGELSDYIIKNVSRRSIVVNLKSQTPTITPAPNLTSKWKRMCF